MNEIKERVEKWIDLMICKYPWIKFVYEVSKDNMDHNICVYPKDLIESSEDYCNDEIDFVFELDKLFPNNGVLFSTEEELFSCSENAEIYQYQTKITMKMSNHNDFMYNPGKIINYSYGDYDYSLVS